MNRYRNAPNLRGPSKASATTMLWKWSWTDFDIRHYSYECKATAQERPYISRPSRTQQLQNPRLMPKLSTEVPDDHIRTNGVADEILAKREEERGRKRNQDNRDRHGLSPKRARSISSHSTNSVATISTTRSTSASPNRERKQSGHAKDRQPSVSPSPGKTRKRRYSDSGDSISGSSYSSGASHRSRSREWAEERNIRRRRRESSPEERGRHRDSRQARDHRRSRSINKSQITKERRSMTPNPGHGRSEQRSYRDRDDPSAQPTRPKQESRARPGPTRERSMSPYSRRLALTQSMNIPR
ncbi:zinc knuckle-domain-containing protein [Penicillium malachiteum]|uniref:Zinc knuckle-domain-containing protein n=1 Tax=Penicillium malachiteum TaxID=1324776 RepID=A0AAD6N1D1_9EURO|nr:zinc knuckle-domain-containing protein [Penicillium malachiteum]